MTYYTMGNPDRTRRCALVIDPSRWLPPDREPRAGAAPVEERFWDGKWTRETRAASLNVNGCRIETSVTESADYPTVTNSVTRYDFLGRVACVHTPAFGGGWLAVSNFYDGASYRLLRVTRTGQPGTLYQYDALGNPTATALDVDGDGVFTAADLATATATMHEQNAVGDWWRVTAQTRSRGGVTNSLGVTREQVTGLSPVLLSRTVAVGADSVTTTVTRAFEPDTEVIATVSQANPAAPSVRRTLYGRELESAGLGSATLSGYDGFARVVAQTVTNGPGTVSTSMIVYDTLGNAVTNSTTYGSLAAVTATGYDSRGRAVSRTDALGNTVCTAYDSLGAAVSRSGAAYPVQYAYDSVGRMTSLATIRNGGAWDVTQWRFDPHTGLATNKVYADDSRIGYTYTSVGKPLRTTWARGEWREHAYNADGLLATTAYSDATPAVSLAYDAFQRLAVASNAVAAYTYANSDLSVATSEVATVNGNTATLTRGLDERHRLADISLAGHLYATYSYDVESRFAVVSNEAFTVAYAYTADGHDVGWTLTATNGTVISRALTRNSYRRGLVTLITNWVNGTPFTPLNYTHDALDRITARNSDTFVYNSRSEVISADVQSTASRYAYDGIGNNLWTSVNATTNTYTANALNQYETINATPLAYDSDGNLLTNGVWSYTWDGENRLKSVYSNSVCVVSNAYDHTHRRVLKVTPTTTCTYLYDGWNLVQETVQTSQSTVTNRFVWGRDLSGSLQGAGGIGGLLAVQMGDAWYFPLFDHNGNVTHYIDKQGSIAAEYTFDAFGRTLTATGPLADSFRHRFSTKYLDVESGLYYYGYRFYAPELRRWLSKDPIGERAGANLYAFAANDSANRCDFLGLCVTVITLGDSLTYGTESRGRTYTGYAKALSIKNACAEAISFGGAGQRIGKIGEGYRDPTAKCDKKVAILAMMGMNDALGLANDRRLPEQQRQDKCKERYDSAIAAWRKLYAGVKGDFDSMADPKPKVLFVTITIPGIGNTPNLRPEYAGIMQHINGFLNSLNTDMTKACTVDGAWWSCATAASSQITHTTGLDAQGNSSAQTSDDGVHFLDPKNKEIADMVSQVVNVWSGE